MTNLCQKCRYLLKNNPMGGSGICTECGGTYERDPNRKDPIPKGFPNGGALYCTYACYQCGCEHGCNNISSCVRCCSTHFYVKAVHFEGFTISVEKPKNDCCMAADAMILVPDKDTFENLKEVFWKTGKAFVRSKHPMGHPMTRSEWNDLLFYGRKGMIVERPTGGRVITPFSEWSDRTWDDYLKYLRGQSLSLEQWVGAILQQHPKWVWFSVSVVAKDVGVDREVVANILEKLCMEGSVVKNPHRSSLYGWLDRVKKDNPVLQPGPIPGIDFSSGRHGQPVPPQPEVVMPKSWFRKTLSWLFGE